MDQPINAAPQGEKLLVHETKEAAPASAAPITLYRATGRARQIDMREFRKISCTSEKFDRVLALLSVCRDLLGPDEHADVIAQIERELQP